MAAALGSPKFQRAASRKGHWPAVETLALDPSLSRLQKLPSPGVMPRAPLPPLRLIPAAHGLGLTVWAAVAALLARRGGGRWGGRAGPHSASGGPPQFKPRGSPEAGGRRCPPPSAWQPRGRRQRGSRGESHWDPVASLRPTPPSRLRSPLSPGAEPGTLSASAPGAAGGLGRRNPARPRAGLRRLQS